MIINYTVIYDLILALVVSFLTKDLVIFNHVGVDQRHTKSRVYKYLAHHLNRRRVGVRAFLESQNTGVFELWRADLPNKKVQVLDEDYLLFIGRISKEKGFYEMKDLFGDKVILLAGELLVDHDELSSTMIHLGIVGNDFLKSVLIQNCKAMILLSQSEANPLVIQEAIAHHKHIYVSDIPAHRELASKFKKYITIV